jgi:hypothetical protein
MTVVDWVEFDSLCLAESIQLDTQDMPVADNILAFLRIEVDRMVVGKAVQIAGTVHMH